MSDTKEITLHLTEDEYKTMMSALTEYGHTCLNESHYFAQKSTIHYMEKINSSISEKQLLDGVKAAQDCGKRAFDIKGKVEQAWEKK